MLKNGYLFLFSVGVILLTSSQALALNDDLSIIPDGWFVPMGVNVGMSVNDEYSDGLLLGGEMSVVHLADTTLFWAGGYLDGLRDFGAEVSRLSCGAQLGWMFGGVEAGYLAQWTGGEIEHGVRIGLIATLGVISLYARYGHVFDALVQSEFVELGMLLKFPFPL